MRPALLRFAKEISDQTDGTRGERRDLAEELAGHLDETFRQLVREGLSDAEAEKQAMLRFGDRRTVGRQIQQALYPYRRAMILSLAAGSLLFGFAVFYAVLFSDWSASPVWLILSSASGGLLLVFAMDPPSPLNRRFALNSMFLLQLAVLLTGTMLVSGSSGKPGGILAAAGWLLILLCLALIYRTSAYDYRTRRASLEKHDITINLMNVTTGVLSVAASLFLLWVYFAFTDGTDRFWLFALVPAGFWALTYLAQGLLLSKGFVKTAYGITGVQLAGLIAGLLLFFRVP